MKQVYGKKRLLAFMLALMMMIPLFFSQPIKAQAAGNVVSIDRVINYFRQQELLGRIKKVNGELRAAQPIQVITLGDSFVNEGVYNYMSIFVCGENTPGEYSAHSYQVMPGETFTIEDWNLGEFLNTPNAAFYLVGLREGKMDDGSGYYEIIMTLAGAANTQTNQAAAQEAAAQAAAQQAAAQAAAQQAAAQQAAAQQAAAQQAAAQQAAAQQAAAQQAAEQEAAAAQAAAQQAAAQAAQQATAQQAAAQEAAAAQAAQQAAAQAAAAQAANAATPANAAGTPGISLDLNWKEIFDAGYYAKRYPDLAKNGVVTEEQLFQHFILCGMAERRVPSAKFNLSKYMKYQDLQKAFGENYPLYYQHYLMFGMKEGRIAK